MGPRWNSQRGRKRIRNKLSCPEVPGFFICTCDLAPVSNVASFRSSQMNAITFLELLPLLTCANFMVIVILYFFFWYFGLIISLLACKFLESRDNNLLSFHGLQFSVEYLTRVMLMTNMTTECTKCFGDQHLLTF